jgi:hypothetical protein
MCEEVNIELATLRASRGQTLSPVFFSIFPMGRGGWTLVTFVLSHYVVGYDWTTTRLGPWHDAVEFAP